MNSKQKYLKYKEKYIALKRQSGGSRSYEEMPVNITVTDWLKLLQDEKLFYDSDNKKIEVSALGFKIEYFTKKQKENINKLIASSASASSATSVAPIVEQVSELEKRRIRDIQIRDTPGIRITIAEYKALPSDKYGFEWIEDDTNSYRNEVTGYIKGRSLAEIEAEKVKRIHQIRYTPGIKITVAEYKALPVDKYGFQWIEERDSSMYHDIDGYVKGKSL